MPYGACKIRDHFKEILFGKSKPSPDNKHIKPFTYCSEERLRIAVAYCMECSDIEKTHEDIIIMGKFLQYAMNNLWNIKFEDPINHQCDGCQAYMPIEDGLHYDVDGKCNDYLNSKEE